MKRWAAWAVRAGRSRRARLPQIPESHGGPFHVLQHQRRRRAAPDLTLQLGVIDSPDASLDISSENTKPAD